MKKLMFMLCALVLAASTQAASVDWQVSYSGKGSAWKDSAVVVLAFAGSDYADIVKLVTKTGSDTLALDLAAKSLNGDGSKFITNLKGTAKTDIVQASDAPESMFWMILADGSYDPGSTVYWTAAIDVSGSLYEPPATGSTLGLNAASFANSGFSSSSAWPVLRSAANTPNAQLRMNAKKPSSNEGGFFVFRRRVRTRALPFTHGDDAGQAPRDRRASASRRSAPGHWQSCRCWRTMRQ